MQVNGLTQHSTQVPSTRLKTYTQEKTKGMTPTVGLLDYLSNEESSVGFIDGVIRLSTSLSVSIKRPKSMARVVGFPDFGTGTKVT